MTIADGVEMPLVGLGTREASDDEVYGAVLTAFEVGYRHIDTATMYRNEAGIGRAIAASDLARDELFVTTKLLASDAGRERELIARSLEALQLEQVDLWLIHWPPNGDPLPGTWQAFIDAREAGQTRAIGVSNYDAAQIDALIAATGATPAVNQVRWAPPLYDAAVMAEHRERGVVLEGYSPFKEADLGRSGARRDRCRPRRDPGPGRAALARRPRRRRDPEVVRPRPHRRELRRLRLLADRKRSSRGSTRWAAERPRRASPASVRGSRAGERDQAAVLADVQRAGLGLVAPLRALERLGGQGEPPLRRIILLPDDEIRLVVREVADERRTRLDDRRVVRLGLDQRDVNLRPDQGLERGAGFF